MPDASGANLAVETFYGKIYAATKPDSAGGETLTVEELNDAKVPLRQVPVEMQRAAWQNVLDEHEPVMPANYVSALRTEFAKASSPTVRGVNAYHQLIGLRKLAEAGLGQQFPSVYEVAKEQTLRESLRLAVDKQVLVHNSPAATKAKQELLAMIDRAATGVEVAFLERAWPMLVKTSGSDQGALRDGSMDVLETAWRRVQRDKPQLNALDTYLEPVRTFVATGAAPCDETLGGLTTAELSTRLDALCDSQVMTRMLLDAQKVRVDAYAKLFEKVFENPTVKRITHEVRQTMARRIEAKQTEQALAGGLVLRADNLDLAVGRAYAKPLYELACKTAKACGLGEDVTLVIATAISPNAFIYDADQNHPRVTAYTPLVDRFWDFEKNDWISLTLDEDNKPCAPDAPGAHTVKVGELLMQGVLAHEFGHIRDEVMLLKSLLVHMFSVFGKDLIAGADLDTKKKIKQAFQDIFAACSPGEMGLRMGQQTQGSIPAELVDLAKADFGVTPIEAAKVLSALDEANGRISAESPITIGDFFRFSAELNTLNRAAEATADRYPVLVQDTAVWAQLVNAWLGLAVEPTSSEAQKKQVLYDLLAMGPEKYAQRMLGELRTMTSLDRLAFSKERSHPEAVTRILQDGMFVADDDELFRQRQTYQNLPPLERLMATVQLFEEALADAGRKTRKIKPLAAMDMTEALVLAQEAKERETALKQQVQPLIELLDAVVDAQSLVTRGSPAYERMWKVIETKGYKLAGQVNFKRLLGYLQQRLTQTLRDPQVTGEAALVVNERLAAVEKLMAAIRKREENDATRKADTDNDAA